MKNCRNKRIVGNLAIVLIIRKLTIISINSSKACALFRAGSKLMMIIEI